MTAVAQSVTIAIDADGAVSGLLTVPARAHAGFVFAHGAGAGMSHPFMAAVADGPGRAHGIATLRFQFPIMERGRSRPDPPAARARRPCGQPSERRSTSYPG